MWEQTESRQQTETPPSSQMNSDLIPPPPKKLLWIWISAVTAVPLNSDI